MRLLVTCRECRRKYDASSLAPGKRFRCLCGKEVTIDEPQGHDARVVCCSSCGAPREKGARRCGHCSGDFTLHEQDLHTVCPQCLARVSDRAKFCHYCGQALAATLVAGERTHLKCPACEGAPVLSSRKLPTHRVAMLECDRCAGLWLEAAMFEELVKSAERWEGEAPAEPSSWARPGSAGASPSHSQEKWRYRNCPVCSKMMQRRNYGRQSGVILDTCRDHGLWLDADELPQILAWVRGGGRKIAQERIVQSQKYAQGTRELVRTLDSSDDNDDRPHWLRGAALDAGSILQNVLVTIFKS
jgi:Zn-finger nucleic acid-binding protein